MALAFNTSVSAILANGKKMGVHANNIANMYSEGFKKSRALLKEGANQTVDVEIEPVIQKVDAGSETSVNQTPDIPDHVNLAEEIVGSMLAQRGSEMNAVAVTVQDEMVGTIIDLIG